MSVNWTPEEWKIIEARDRERIRTRESIIHSLDPESQADKLGSKRTVSGEEKTPPSRDAPEMVDVNMAAASKTSGTQTNASRTGNQGETPLDYIPITRFQPFDHTTQVVMPYYVTGSVICPASGTAPSVLQLRMNSIYDVIVASPTYTAFDPTSGSPVTSDTADAALARETPYMRKYWMTYYSYWHVVGSRIRIRVAPETNNIQASTGFYFFEHGRQNPPIVATGTTAVLHALKIRQRNFKKYSFVPCLDLEDTTTAGMIRINRERLWQTVYETSWTDGKIDHAVMEDEFAQTWHMADQVPPTPEFLTMHVQLAPTSGNSGQTWRYELSIEYLVQLKDLKDQYDQLTQNSAIATISAYAEQQTV